MCVWVGVCVGVCVGGWGGGSQHRRQIKGPRGFIVRTKERGERERERERVEEREGAKHGVIEYMYNMRRGRPRETGEGSASECRSMNAARPPFVIG